MCVVSARPLPESQQWVITDKISGKAKFEVAGKPQTIS